MALSIYFLLGIIAGITAGLFGIGGGIVLVPVLSFLFAFSLPSAIGTSLAAMLLPVGLFAALEYYRNGLARPKVAVIIAISMFVGVYFGSKIGILLPQATMKQIYAVFLLITSFQYLGIKFPKTAKQKAPSSSVPADFSVKKILLLGIVAGIVSGLFGVAGGIVIVPMLLLLMKYDHKTAVGTSLMALLFPSRISGVILYYQSGNLDISIATLIAIGLVIGSFIGAKINISLNEKVAKKIFATFLLVVSVYFFVTPLL